MKSYIQHIIEESIKDEVNVDKEWARLLPLIEDKRTVVRMDNPKSKVFQFIRYAAAILIGGILSFSALYLAEDRSEPIAGTYKLVTAKGEKSYLQLPDGTKVWLNSCTTLEYSQDYGESNRILSLDGEAYFEVAKDQEHPFIVKANGVDIEALGTVFNVCAYGEDPRLTTTLFSGKVAVQPTLTKQQVLLDPNQVAVYYKSKNRIEVIPYDKKQFAQWKDGFLSFEMMNMREITKLLERNYNVVFLYQNQKIKDLRFSGSFRNSEDLSEILNVIKTNTGIRYEIKKDTIVIK